MWVNGVPIISSQFYLNHFTVLTHFSVPGHRVPECGSEQSGCVLCRQSFLHIDAIGHIERKGKGNALKDTRRLRNPRSQSMFYCIAMQAGASLSWQWKSTPLSSLDAVLGFLRLHRALRQNRLRVFSSASREGLDEQFKREQGAMGFHSVTATQFLRE